MTNPNTAIDTRNAALALAQFRNAPTASAEERALWGRDDIAFHRRQRSEHYLRHAGAVAAALETLLAQLQLTQAARGTVTDAHTDAHTEAHRRYNSDTIIDETTGEPTSHDDWGYAECQRRAFVAGAEWAGRSPWSTFTRDQINAAALELYGASATYDPARIERALKAAFDLSPVKDPAA